MTNGGFIVSIFFVMIYDLVLKGFALSVLWKWFIVPTFDIVELSVVSAMGVMCIASCFMGTTDTDKDKDKSYEQRLFEGVFMATAKPVLILLIGWIVSLFM